MVDAHALILASSADSTAFSHAVMTSSRSFTIAVQFLASNVSNVSLLLPLNFSTGSPLNLARFWRFQNTRWVASCPIEGFFLPSRQLACSALRPWIAMLGGTNQSS